MSKPRRPRRPIDGILLLDKPIGVTSNQILQWVKHRYQADKAGHTGSLDPLATGVLPICLGEATKYSHYLLDADKTYVTRLKLGEKTNTSDAEGEIIASGAVPALDANDIEAVLKQFRGDIMQVPSMFSALKRNGRPLYELARAGIEVEREARPVSIYKLSCEAIDLPYVELTVSCSKGTYIRNLVEDIGDVIGCGAHVVALRRTQAGPFDLSQSYTREQIAEAEPQGFPALDTLLLPAWAGLADWPRVELSETSAYYLRHGNPVQANGLPRDGQSVLIFERQDDGQPDIFLGIGSQDDDGLLAPKRLVRVANPSSS
ncbi:MAG: tRNA pseudouridine(55) synthase TruB [Paraperlucidibaca sp.]